MYSFPDDFLECAYGIYRYIYNVTYNVYGIYINIYTFLDRETFNSFARLCDLIQLMFFSMPKFVQRDRKC